ADPDPDDERIEADAQLRRLVAHAGEHDVQIHLCRRADADLRRGLELRLLVAVEVLSLLARQDPLRHAVAEHLETDRGDEPVERLRRRHALAHEAPAMSERIDELLRLAGPELNVVVFLERQPGECGEEDDDARVDDVAAVAPTIAPDKPDDRGREGLTVDVAARRDPLL